jgi:hypothetical protein
MKKIQFSRRLLTKIAEKCDDEYDLKFDPCFAYTRELSKIFF